MSTLARAAPLYVIAAALVACGGGGNDAGFTGPIQAPLVGTVNVGSAWHNFLTVPHSWSMPGTRADGTPFQFDLNLTPGPFGTFAMNGLGSLTTGQGFRFTLGGRDPVVGNNTLFFNNDSLIGISTGNGGCGIARNTLPLLPAAGQLGSNGGLFILDNFTGCGGLATRDGTSTISWSIQSDGGFTMFCLSTRETNFNGAPIGSEIDCIEVSPRGDLGFRAKFTITLADGSVLFGRNF